MTDADRNTLPGSAMADVDDDQPVPPPASDNSTGKGAGGDAYFNLVHVYLFVSFFMGSALTSVFPHAVLTVAKAAELGCIFCGVAYCYVNRSYTPVIIAAFALIYGVFVLLRFVDIAGVSFNFSAGYPIYAFGGVAVMYGAMRKCPDRVIRLLFGYAIFYVVVLFLFSFVPFLRSMLMHSALVGGGHGENGAGRISVTFLYPVMVAALGVEAALRRKMNGTMLALLLMALACIVVSDFRMGIAISLAVMAGYALMRMWSFRIKNISRVFTAGTVLAFTILASLYVLNLNPYLLLFHDISAFGRAIGFNTIRGMMLFSPVWGGGIPPDAAAFNWSGNQGIAKFYDSDYGIFGILVWGGIVAEVLYLTVLFLTYRFAEDLQRIGVNTLYIGGLAVTGWFQMVYNITMPTNMTEGYNAFGCLILACMLLAIEKKKARPTASRRVTACRHVSD